MDQAEKLFADKGYHGVSLREIMKSCDVQLAAIAYYFGTKEKLFREVLKRRSSELNQMRHARFDAALAESPTGRLSERAVIEALVGPFFERNLNGGAGWRNFCSLLSHTTISSEWGELISEFYDDIAQRTITLLSPTDEPDKRDKAVSAYLFIVGIMAVIFSRTGRLDRLSAGSYESNDITRVYADAVPFLVGGVRALLGRDEQA